MRQVSLFLFCFVFGFFLPLFIFSHESSPQEQKIGIIVEVAHEKEVISCRFCASVINSGKIHRDGPHIIENQLRDFLLQKGFKAETCDMENERCIYVLLYRFEEKRGGDFSVEKPASVGFHMHLIEKMQLYGSYTFDEEQKPLFSDLLGLGKFIKRRGRWVDASTLSEEGIKKGLEKLLSVQR